MKNWVQIYLNGVMQYYGAIFILSIKIMMHLGMIGTKRHPHVFSFNPDSLTMLKEILNLSEENPLLYYVCNSMQKQHDNFLPIALTSIC